MFQWNGEQLLKKVRNAEKTGLFTNGTRVCMEARSRVRVDTSALQSSIKPQTNEPTETGTGFELLVGSDTDLVEYAAIQELGPAQGQNYSFTPYIRPSVDSEFSKIAGDIKEALG